MGKQLSKAEMRKKFGTAGVAIPATRVLQMDLEHFQEQGIDGKSLIVINDKEGTFTSANVYDGNLGKNYDAEGMTHSLPAPDSDKWKTWRKKGYVEGDVANFDVLQLVSEDVETEVETETETETETEVEADEIEA